MNILNCTVALCRHWMNYACPQMKARWFELALLVAYSLDRMVLAPLLMRNEAAKLSPLPMARCSNVLPVLSRRLRYTLVTNKSVGNALMAMEQR